MVSASEIHSHVFLVIYKFPVVPPKEILADFALSQQPAASECTNKIIYSPSVIGLFPSLSDSFYQEAIPCRLKKP